MSPAEHTLAALTALSRARQALDVLWLDCRPLVPSASQLDRSVHDIVAELVSAHDEIEHVIEYHLRSVVDDPQSTNVANWPTTEENDNA